MPAICGSVTAGMFVDFDASPEVAQHDAAGRIAKDVLRLHVAVEQPGAMNGLQRATDLDADPRRLYCRHRPASSDLRGQRLAADVLGPNADTAVDTLGTVDRQHIGMPDAREQPSFFDDRRRRVGGVLGDQFQGDFAVETGIPGAIDVAERSAANLLEDDERAPLHTKRLVQAAVRFPVRFGQDCLMRSCGCVDWMAIASPHARERAVRGIASG